MSNWKDIVLNVCSEELNIKCERVSEDLVECIPGQVDGVGKFLEMGVLLLSKATLPQLVADLNTHLGMRTFLVGFNLSAADVCVYCALLDNPRWEVLLKTGVVPMHVLRWSKLISTLLAKYLVKENESKRDDSTGSFDIGYVDKSSPVCTRFPPEPSGYLHIGHAKAALLNDFIAKKYNGELILRFDDTNPTKEKQEFEDSIIADLISLGIHHHRKTYTSDSFELILSYATELLEKGLAYVDNTDMLTIREERAQRIESKCRDASVQDNLSLWEEMKQGSDIGIQCCVRIKMDMKSDNGCLRDPVIYRCKVDVPHHRTGTRYKIYPTYDFACPIVDSIEGVSHALRTTEYHDRDIQYYMFCELLNIRKPRIEDYSRLNFVFTLLSKRKLTWFVDNGYVNGWDDPRMPTVRGMLRRGLEVEALRQFIILQGASKSNNLMQYDKLWNINKKFIDPIAHRYTCLMSDNLVQLEVSKHLINEVVSVPLHPKNPELGDKMISRTSNVFIEQNDAMNITVGEEVTLMGWGNVIVDDIQLNDENKIVKIVSHLHLEGSVKDTKSKITWIGQSIDSKVVDITLVTLSSLITVPKIEMQKFEDVLAPVDQTWVERSCIGEHSITSIKPGQTIQINRKGFFRCESIDSRIVLIYIPDGKKYDFM